MFGEITPVYAGSDVLSTVVNEESCLLGYNVV
jgi:hypothetical protein